MADFGHFLKIRAGLDEKEAAAKQVTPEQRFLSRLVEFIVLRESGKK